MGDDAVARVRRFNRLVTQRVGALQDHYLARDRPLGAARLLWEIGEGDRTDGGGCDVRALRASLDLDSGYLSRLLRGLEADGLVTVGPSNHDRRVRTARLTPSGAAERARLDRRSDALARSLLDPPPPPPPPPPRPVSGPTSPSSTSASPPATTPLSACRPRWPRCGRPPGCSW